MYNLPEFKAHNQQEVLAFMKAHPFITLCGVDNKNQLVATHVPVLFVEKEGKLFLQAHIMRKTGHHLAFEHNPNVLAIFTGPHTYVSASWYPNPKVGSTWNYQAVHASGVLRFGNDAELYELLTQLTSHFENNPHSPSLMKDLPEDYVTSLMKAIVVFEIEITNLQHVFKLSQNHTEESRERIIEKLEGQPDVAGNQMADIMKIYFEKP